MSVDTYLGLRAVALGRAVPRATRRHVHLAAEPLVVVGYHMPGDPGAPIGLIYGNHRNGARTAVVGEPRNGKLRFTQLADFAMDLNGYFGRYIQGVPSRSARRTASARQMPPAPQLILPNAATAQWLCDVMGRRLRTLDIEGEYAVHPALPNIGAHLSFFASQRVPGSSLVLPLTDLLSQHWTTGQLDALDADLAVQLAWIDNPAGIEEAQRALPAGPVPDGGWEEKDLSDAIKAFQRLSDSGSNITRASEPMKITVEAALHPAWQACWDAVELLHRLPVADSVQDRWEMDRYQWHRHAERVRANNAYFSRRPQELQVMRLLTRLERLTANLTRDMALDDPLVMANYIASGDALSGEITRRDAAGNRPSLSLRPDMPFRRPVGTELHWFAEPVRRPDGLTRPMVTVEVTSADETNVELRVVRGAVRQDRRRLLPQIGDRVVFSQFGRREFRRDTLPAELPWTHVGVEGTGR
ncbi:hypothetical protein ABIH81_19255 [Micromonospora sp. HUAS YX12]|uniref:Uncharacterized protein n=1 Tax=Micromonospora sp. HUAS YX12 TaxID=3156396 RepID=A0AAU7QWV2_9ACTN